MYYCSKCGTKKRILDFKHKTCKKCGGQSFKSEELDKVTKIISNILSK